MEINIISKPQEYYYIEDGNEIVHKKNGISHTNKPFLTYGKAVMCAN